MFAEVLASVGSNLARTYGGDRPRPARGENALVKVLPTGDA